MCQTRLKLSWKVKECKPLCSGWAPGGAAVREGARLPVGCHDVCGGRGLHSSTSQFNLSHSDTKHTLLTP